jgi:hypothetical protein
MSRRCRTNQHIFVATRHTASENQHRERRGELTRKNSYQAFIRRAINRRSRYTHEQAPVAHAANAFRRGAWAHAQAQDQVRALNGAP